MPRLDRAERRDGPALPSAAADATRAPPLTGLVDVCARVHDGHTHTHAHVTIATRIRTAETL